MGLCGILLVASAIAAQARTDSTWRDHDRAADSAAAHGDWRDYLRHVWVIDSALSQRSSVTIALARGYARLGDTARALSMLRDFAASGLTRALATDSDFASLHSSPPWKDLRAVLSANGARRMLAPVAFTLRDTGFVAEDLAFDAKRGRFLFSGIKGRRVVARERDGTERDLITQTTAGPLWAVMGLGIDSTRDRLWVSTAADDRIPGLPTGARPRASLLRVRLEDGSVERRIDFPNDGQPHEPGDLAVAPNGDLYVSDGRFGAVYVIRPGADSLEILLPPGTLNGPQEPAISPDGRVILVPDYLGGIYLPSPLSPLPSGRGGRESGGKWLRHKRSIVLNGIDGLKWSGPHTLIAVQNGTNPRRVVRLTLDASLSEVIRADVLAQGDDLPDPTHGIVVNGDYYVIARAGWDEPSLPPVVARLRDVLTR